MKKLLHFPTVALILTMAHTTIIAQTITANFTPSCTCFNNPITFIDASTSNPYPISTWLWKFGDGNISLNQNTSHTYSSIGTYTVTLIVTDSNGDRDSVQHFVCVNPIPLTYFYSTTVCNGNSTAFTDLSSIASGTINSWSWNFDDPASAGNNISNLQNPYHQFTSAGNFNVTLTTTSDSGCQNTTIMNTIVNTNPVASFTSSANNDTVFFTETNPPMCSYFWDFGDGNTSTAQNPYHIYSSTYNEFYTVCFSETSCSGCTDSICHQINSTTGIAEQNIIEKIIISPNPLSSSTILQTNKVLNNATLIVYNSFGQQVKQLKNISGHTVTLYRDNLPSGLYFIRLTSSPPLLLQAKGEIGEVIYTSKLIITDR